MVDDRHSVISDEVPGETDVSFGVLKRRPEVLGGFAADARLANYDVFGLGTIVSFSSQTVP